MTFFFSRWSGKQLRPDIDPLRCSVGVVDGMPRAGSRNHLGTSRGPDKIESRAGLGPRAVSCTWLMYILAYAIIIYIDFDIMVYYTINWLIY